MIDTGCKKIAFYGSPMNLEISKNRYNGYHDALVKHGLTENPDWVKICDDRANAEAITPDILIEEDRPDAFFAINDDTAIGILYTAKRMGFKGLMKKSASADSPMVTVPRRATRCLLRLSSEV